MDDSIGTEDIDGNNSAVEVDSQAFETDVGAQTLRLATNAFASEQAGNGVDSKDAPSWVKVGRDMVGKYFLQILL